MLVTGATGGVGTVRDRVADRGGVHRGRDERQGVGGEVSQATWRDERCIDRNEFTAAGKPLQKERWAGVVDCVGSHTLANACAQTKYGGAVAACGLAQGMDFPATVAPFILRGVSLLGIDSVMAPKARRTIAWERLARDLNAGALDAIAQDIGLGEAIASAGELMDGKVRGRVVVDVNR